MLEYNPTEKAFLQFLEEEEKMYEHQLHMLEKVKNKHVFSFRDLEPYQQMLSRLSRYNVRILPYRSAFIVTQISRMISTFLRDLQQLLKEYSFRDKEEVLKEIERLIQKAKEIMDAYYEVYRSLPYSRYYESWYYSDRTKYLPFYPYEEHYAKAYPKGKIEEKLEDAIFRELTSEADYYDSRQFVPCSFQGTQGEYSQYLALQAYKELRKLQPKPLALEQDSNLPLSERLLNRIRKGE